MTKAESNEIEEKKMIESNKAKAGSFRKSVKWIKL